MKNLKILFTVVIAILVLAMSAEVFAYGSQVDTMNVITMPSSLSNGKGEVLTTITGSMSYQFVEITAEKYATIAKYEAIYNLINAYIKNDSNYDSIATNYENKYNQTANGIMTEYGIQFNEEGLNAIKGLWISELTTYDSSAWVVAEGKTISIDLTTFEGTKYYIAWVQIGDTYDAEIYTLVGTKKQEEPKQEEPKQEEPSKEEPKQEETPKENITENVKNTDTTVSKTVLPKTGLKTSIIGIIMVSLIGAVISYTKYSKIK